MVYVKLNQNVPWYRKGALGRNINHDPRSWNYRVSRTEKPTSAVLWDRTIPVLDQKNLGSCTGNAGIGALYSKPNVQPFDQYTIKFPGNEDGAVALYSAASKLDSDPDNYPPTDTGSDGLSVAKALTSAGLISGYQHAFGIDDAFSAIQQGPLIVGTYWYNGMFSPNRSGVVVPTGAIAGGHEYECIGYDPATDLWEFVNSWGTSWGVKGHFFYSTATFTKLLAQQGDIVLFTPATVPAPTPIPAPTPTPSPAPADAFTTAATVLDPWAVKNARQKAAQAWTTYAKTVRNPG